MRGRSHDVAIRNRIHVFARGNQTGDMRHIDHQHCADGIGDLAQRGEIDLPRICARTGNDHFRLALLREIANIVVIQPLRFRV